MLLNFYRFINNKTIDRLKMDSKKNGDLTNGEGSC